MHATKLVTPEIMIIIGLGIFAFLVVYKLIFKKKP
jgi:hypothetical protein